MRKILLLFFLQATLICSAQQKLVDSLLIELKKHPQQDSGRVNILNQLAVQYPGVDPAKGLVIANESINLCIKLNLQLKLGHAYISLAKNYGATSAYDKDLEYNEKAVAIFQKFNDETNIARTFMAIGLDYRFFLDFTTALSYLQKATSIYQKLNDTSGWAKCIGNMGVLYTNLHQSQKAIESYQQAYELFAKRSDLVSMQLALNNIGDAYIELGDYAKAKIYTSRSLQISIPQNFTRAIANSYTDLGIEYTGLKQYDSALFYLDKALPLYEKLSAKRNISIALNATADVYANAPDSFLSAYGIAPALKYTRALLFAKRGLAIATEIGDVDLQYQEWEMISGYYEKQKDFANALAAHKQYAALKDSILNDDKKDKVTRMEMQYGFDKKQAAAAAALQQQQTIRNAIIAGVALVLICGMVIFFFYRKRKDTKQLLHQAELKAQVAETEMKALRAQMNPHFIFNSLNSIADYIEKNQNQTAAGFTVKFAKLMRMVLENSEHKEIPLSDDLKILELYMQLESLRLQNKFTYEIKVDEAIDRDNTLIPPLMLQPFVENSIWHGIVKKEGNGHIVITIKKEGDLINCIVEDDGVGMTTAEAANSNAKSLGIKITRARIDVINQQKNTNASVKVSARERGVMAEIRLPYQVSF